eukprot:6463688-Amphidinium_carterae.1
MLCTATQLGLARPCHLANCSSNFTVDVYPCKPKTGLKVVTVSIAKWRSTCNVLVCVGMVGNSAKCCMGSKGCTASSRVMGLSPQARKHLNCTWQVLAAWIWKEVAAASGYERHT